MKNLTFLEKGFVSPNDEKIMGENDSQSIQNAVDFAVECGIRKVVIPKYNRRTGGFKWLISKSILLPSDIEIVLDDCYLLMEDDVFENFFRTDNLFTEKGTVCEKEYEHITIRGTGHAVLDGGKPMNGLNEYTMLKNGLPHVAVNSPILFFNVRYFSVSNIAILNQRYWGMRFAFCKCGKISDIFICAVRNKNNQDGIDIRNGCNNILIENIFAQTGDDTIALTAIDGPGEGKYNMFAKGQDSSVHGITIRNIWGCALIHPLVALRNHNGAKLYDITVDNVRDTEPLKKETVDVYIQKGYTVTSSYIEKIHEDDKLTRCSFCDFPRYGVIHVGDKAYYRVSHSVMGDTCDININNVSARYSERAIVLGCELQNIRITNVNTSGECRYAVSSCPEEINGGPDVKLKNIYIDGINMKGESDRETAPVYFGDIVADDYISNMNVSNVTAENTDHIAVVSKKAEISFSNVRYENLKGDVIKVNGDNKDIKISGI